MDGASIFLLSVMQHTYSAYRSKTNRRLRPGARGEKGKIVMAIYVSPEWERRTGDLRRAVDGRGKECPNCANKDKGVCDECVRGTTGRPWYYVHIPMVQS